MRIPGYELFRLRDASLPGGKVVPKGGQPGPSPNRGAEAGDRVELSAQAKEGAALRYDVAVTSDARTERVAAVAQRVEDGTYSATSDAIADGLIRAAIFERIL